MVPISEPISNHFLLSLLILLPSLGLVAYAPWNKLGDVRLSVNDKKLLLSQQGLIKSLKYLLLILAVFASLSIFSLGLTTGLAWLRYPYLGLAIVASIWAISQKN